MTCKETRDGLLAARQPSPPIGEHLASCAECADFARRAHLVRDHFKAHRYDFSPRLGFANRVLAQLPRGPELLAWAALRALPAALAIAMALAWMSYSEPPSVETLLSAEPSPDLLLTTGALAPELHR